jgi:hypothetical protein
MGAKTWMLVHSKGDPKEFLHADAKLDRDVTTALVKQLYPSEKLAPLHDGDSRFTCPPDHEIVAACFPGVTIVAAKEFGIDYPAKLASRFVDAFSDGTLYLHAMHSVVDWFAFGVWRNGVLQRSLSLSPDSGIMEDIGDRLPFEQAYWTGGHPAVDPGEDPANYPFPFHPLDLAEAALLAFFGYQLEGVIDPAHIQPERIPLMRFERKKDWWKFW